MLSKKYQYRKPSIVFDNKKFIVLIMKKIYWYYQAGCLKEDGQYRWGEIIKFQKFRYIKNISVAMHANGIVVVVCETSRYYFDMLNFSLGTARLCVGLDFDPKYLSAYIGKINEKKLSIWWRKKYPYYDKGVTPSVAIADDGTIVEVHKSQDTSFLYYNLGSIFHKKLFTSSSIRYSRGRNPSIAVCIYGKEKYVLEAHTHSKKNEIYYLRGNILKSGKGICWNSKFFDDRLRENAIKPSVILKNDMSAAIVFQDVDCNRKSTLCFTHGKILKNLSKKGFSKCYSLGKLGYSPSVVQLKPGKLFIVYESKTKLNSLTYTMNLSDKKVISMFKGSIFDAAFHNDIDRIKNLLDREKTKKDKKKLLNSRYKMEFGDKALQIFCNTISLYGILTGYFNTTPTKKITKNSYNRTLWTPLHFVVAGNAYNAVVFLISKGAKTDLVDSYGRTYRDIAKHYRDKSFLSTCDNMLKIQNKNKNQKNKVQKYKNLVQKYEGKNKLLRELILTTEQINSKVQKVNKQKLHM